MNKLQDLTTQRQALYKELQKVESTHKKEMKKYRIKRQELGNKIEEYKELILNERGVQELELSKETLEIIDDTHLATWLKSNYSGSDALATIAGTQVRKEYQTYTKKRVPVHTFRRAMNNLGFESRTVRVVNGGGYVTRAWVRST